MVTVSLTKDDKLAYDRLENESRAAVGRHLSAGTLVQNYTHVLAIIMRLRQVGSLSKCIMTFATLSLHSNTRIVFSDQGLLFLRMAQSVAGQLAWFYTEPKLHLTISQWFSCTLSL